MVRRSFAADGDWRSRFSSWRHSARVRAGAGPEEALRGLASGAGVALILVAIFGRLWCTLYIGGRKGTEIVRHGPYSVTRNPLYLFSMIGAAGVGALGGSIVVMAAFAALSFAVLQAETRREEASLSLEYGEPYRCYMSEVPRFLPDFRLFTESEFLLVRPQHIYRTLADSLVFIAAWPFFRIVEYLQQGGVLRCCSIRLERCCFDECCAFPGTSL